MVAVVVMEEMCLHGWDEKSVKESDWDKVDEIR